MSFRSWCLPMRGSHSRLSARSQIFCVTIGMPSRQTMSGRTMHARNSLRPSAPSSGDRPVLSREKNCRGMPGLHRNGQDNRCPRIRRHLDESHSRRSGKPPPRRQCFTKNGTKRKLKAKGAWEKAAKAAGLPKSDGVGAFQACLGHYDACHEALVAVMAAVSSELLTRIFQALKELSRSGETTSAPLHCSILMTFCTQPETFWPTRERSDRRLHSAFSMFWWMNFRIPTRCRSTFSGIYAVRRQRTAIRNL